jgi:hypothetical protein
MLVLIYMSSVHVSILHGIKKTTHEFTERQTQKQISTCTARAGMHEHTCRMSESSDVNACNYSVHMQLLAPIDSMTTMMSA